MSCRVWQVRHASASRVAPAGTRRRFVVPQRVHTHSAVVVVMVVALFARLKPRLGICR
jgi:hypothetical protein